MTKEWKMWGEQGQDGNVLEEEVDRFLKNSMIIYQMD
jgi:hypothetical protein